MWSRAEIKQRGKHTFRLNYWRCVAITVIIMFIAGGIGGSLGSSVSVPATETQQVADQDMDADMDYPVIDNDPLSAASTALLVTFAVTFIIIFVIALAISCLINVFLGNPIVIGGKRFFVRNLHEKAQIGNMGFAFDTNYMNIVKVMFFKDLYTILWSLLFIIPGVIKSYEYRMIPYILADNPDVTKEDAFGMSRQMMYGNKWKVFVLDLSFIGWHMLSLMTCGAAEIFYVQPYVEATNAALYESLRYSNNSESIQEQ